VGSTPDDHRVNGGAAFSMAVEGTTRGWRGMLSMEVMRRAKEWGVAGHCLRRTVRVWMSTGSGDVVRRCIREERSVGRRGISGMGVWWR
jgi:hypothetical protein